MGQVWKAIAQKAELTKVQWVVKVDADAVFVPNRLRTMLQGHPVTYTGIYIENCKSVQWGFFGNLEVFSIEAFNTLLANIDSCSQKIDWVKGTNGGPSVRISSRRCAWTLMVCRRCKTSMLPPTGRAQA